MRGLLRRFLRPRARGALDASPVDARRGPAVELALGAPGVQDTRDVHRWFYDLARTGQGAQACDRLGEWILADRPGEGAEWEHASDAALRLVYWGLGAGLLGDELDPDLWRRMAGSARAHATFTLGSDSPNPATQGAGLVVAGATFADLSDQWLGEGLGLLTRSLNGIVEADGSGDGHAVQRAVALAVVARSFTALPSEAEGAVRRGASYLRVASTGGPLPGDARYAPLLGESADELATHLGEEPLDVAKDWAIRAYRASDQAVGHAKLKGAPSRVFAHGGALSWHLDGELLVRIVGARGELSSARVDGRRATLGWGDRKFRAEGGRVQLVEHDCSGVRIERGPGWDGLKVDLDDQLTWQEIDGGLVGVGAGDRIRCSFELR